MVFPTNGFYFRLFQELAGLGGNVRFLKNEVQSSLSSFLTNKITSSVAFYGGLLASVPGDEEFRPRINDRFLLGGPLSIRGFHVGGVGPRDKGT